MDETLWAGRVVVGVDGSPESRLAADWAAVEATARGRGLTVVHAVLPPVGSSSFGPSMPVGLNVMAEIRDGALAELDAIAASLSAPDIRTHVEVGSPSGTLIGASETSSMVVVGSRGQGGFKGLILGSVSTQVATHSVSPAIVVRALPDPGADTVVVGIDGNPGSNAAIDFAFEMASRHGWRLVAVHAWEAPAYDVLVVPSTTGAIPLDDLSAEEARMSAESLAGFTADYPDVVVEESIVHGSARSAIIEASARAALVVVGTRGHGQVVGAVIGSVSHGVLHHARVPVAVISGRRTARVTP